MVVNILSIDRIQEIEIKILYKDPVNKNVEIKDLGILNIIDRIVPTYKTVFTRFFLC